MENKKLNPSREDNIYSLFESVIPDFHKAKKGVNGWMQSKCPLHEDKSPSFSFNLNGGWNCFSGCGKGDASDLAEKLGMDPKPYYQYVIDTKAVFKPIISHIPIRAPRVIPIIKYVEDDKVLPTLDFKLYKNNNYMLFLKDIIGKQGINEFINAETTFVGTYKEGHKFNNAAIFWYVNKDAKICFGKVQQYSRNGKRVKKPNLTKRIYNSGATCFYNEYTAHNSSKPLSIVESEKTADLMSFYRPDQCWLATGGESQLNSKLIKSFKGKNISLYPDQGFYDKWSQFAKENPEYKIEVSKDCEYWFEQKEIAAGGDIADYYLKNHNLRYDAQWNQDEYNPLFSKK
jgi:hypothetical protein